MTVKVGQNPVCCGGGGCDLLSVPNWRFGRIRNPLEEAMTPGDDNLSSALRLFNRRKG
jgi:hypothetical protein